MPEDNHGQGAPYRALLNRRVLSALGAYLAASWAVVEFVDWLGGEGPSRGANLIAVALAVLSPSVIVIARGRERGRRATRARWVFLAFNLFAAGGLVAALAGRTPGSAMESPVAVVTREQVTFTGDATDPAFSPDGSRIAYVRRVEGRGSLIVRDLATGREEELLQALPSLSWVKWSPDSRFLLFVTALDSLHRVPDGEDDVGLHVVPATGGDVRWLTPHPLGAWSPDGGTVAYTASRRDTIWFLRLDSRDAPSFSTSDRPYIALDRAWEFLQALEWSPSGEWLALIGREEDRSTVWTVRPNGSDQTLVSEGTAALSNLSWAPTGDALFFRSGWILQRVPISRETGQALSEPKQVEGAVFRRPLSVSVETGQVMAIDSRVLRSMIFFPPGQDGPGREILPEGEGGAAGFPRVSPDGTTLAFWRYGGISTMSLSGGEVTEIARVPGANIRYLAWSPDGSQLAYSAEVGGGGFVYVLRVGDSSYRRFAIVEAGPLDWCSQGIFYFGSDNIDQYLLDPATGESELVLSPDRTGSIATPRCSPDGSEVASYYNQSPLRGVIGVSLIERSERVIVDSPARGGAVIDWTENGRWIYFASGRSTVFRVPAGGGQVDSVMTLPYPPNEIVGVDMTPDGSAFIVVRQRVESDLWMLEGIDLLDR